MTKKQEVLRQIINILSINLQNDVRIGLMNGRMGISILLYHYARLTGNEQCRYFPDMFMEKMEDHILACSDKNIFDGSTGICQGIDYVMKNGFIEADEEVLNDIDTFINAVDGDENLKDLDSEVPLFAKGLYFLQRGSVENINKSLLETLHFIKTNPSVALPVMYINSIVYVALVSSAESDNKEFYEKLLNFLHGTISKKTDLKIDNQDYFLLKKNISLMPEQQAMKWSKLIPDEYQPDDIPDCCWIDFIFPKGERIPVDIDKINMWIRDCLDQFNSDKMYLYKGLTGIGLSIINKL